MTDFMLDPSLWTQSDALQDVLASSPSSPSSSSSSSRRNVTSGPKRRSDDDNELLCAHCGRCVTQLFFTNACTYECALRLASTASYRYDFVYTAISSMLTRDDVYVPRLAPQLHDDTITPEEYWRRVLKTLYPHDAVMTEYLRERLEDNKSERRGDGDKKQRAH